MTYEYCVSYINVETGEICGGDWLDTTKAYKNFMKENKFKKGVPSTDGIYIRVEKYKAEKSDDVGELIGEVFDNTPDGFEVKD